MADVTLIQVRGTTHHYTALIDVDPAMLEPTIDLLDAVTESGDPIRIPDSIEADLFLEDGIEAEFEALTNDVKGCVFKPGSYNVVKDASGHVIERTIQLQITTIAVAVQEEAIKMLFEFLHSVGR